MGIDSQTAVVIERGRLRCIGKSYAATVVPVAAREAVRFDFWSQEDEVELASLFATATAP
jgi:hypothetical protein